MEEAAKFITTHLTTGIEIIAAFVIMAATIKFLVRYLKHLTHPDDGHSNRSIRIHFGSALTLSLELLLAADILNTAIAPTWEEIGKLAAIAAIRTALNYFLERELKEERKAPAAGSRDSVANVS